MKMVDTKSGGSFRVRVNRTGCRTYSREYKLEVVEECSALGASLAAVALSHRINANLAGSFTFSPSGHHRVLS